MSRLVERLASHVELMKSETTASTTVRLMSLIRQVAEENGGLTQYPTLRLFADWCVHSKLDRKDAENILAEIEEALRIEMKSAGHFTPKNLLNPVSPRRLQEEMSQFLLSLRIHPTLTESRFFGPIARKIMEEVSDKPLQLSEAKRQHKLGEKRGPDEIIQGVASFQIARGTGPASEKKFEVGAQVMMAPGEGPRKITVATELVIDRDTFGNSV